MTNTENMHWHGKHGSPSWEPPTCVTQFGVAARDYCADKIMAHEYQDCETVLKEKVKTLAGLVRKSKQLVAFTGAGISTAAGIDDYASKAKGESVTAAGKPIVKDWKDARPTKSHRVLAALHTAGHLKHWIQQNHDSLPQKAGYPQHCLNEIHGSMHDPANPIVPYEGTLRNDLFDWLHEWQTRADLVVAMGTSLSGFNVDSIADAAGSPSHRGLGLVIINLQQTPYDDRCALRIFGRLDSVLELLAVELAIDERVLPMDHDFVPDIAPGALIEDDMVKVPFDGETGEPVPDEPTRWATWDLRIGSRVKLTGGTYEGDVGTVMNKRTDGAYRIRFEDSINPTFNVKRRPFSLWLGSWWLQEASHGHGITPGGRIPFVNVPGGPLA
eukprot:CAMPEP_0174718066 /NCGR_PEP_ID=MMETSP1094-20130205/27960_1 /TAXON_ID=156173 /ORGANISM="Chrysochromulina brevifilum, Strain UTEX LB 985" /LENGTH=384 /DNA_ID=CAMNT_0015918095 /DNA_START=43 /DNA_END=1197 /DNA_ORIENTATION=-